MKDGKHMLEEFGRDSKLNFDSYADNLETFAMLEMKNREIDQWNLKMKQRLKFRQSETPITSSLFWQNWRDF